MQRLPLPRDQLARAAPRRLLSHLLRSWRSSCLAAAATNIDTNSKKEQEEPLWEADWDDQDKSQDFASKLKAELDKGMKE
jgi:hypothetical protein